MARAENVLKVQFCSLSANESLARSLAGAYLMQLNPTVGELADVKCAVSEAVTNCIVHAYRGCIGKIVMSMSVYPDRRVKIEIRDRGCGIDDIEQAMEPMFSTGDSEERSGMGFTVMESFTDKLKVRSEEGRGTTVIMIKYLDVVSGI